MTFQTRLASWGLTVGIRLIARDTVAVETRARLAISRMSIDVTKSPRTGRVWHELGSCTRLHEWGYLNQQHDIACTQNVGKRLL